jgi:SPP1 family predicted phage head-tail adaptor
MGDAIPADTKKQVYANKKSIRQSEFYQAAATGLRPELMFEVRTSDYNGQPKLEYESVTYNIIRTYDKNGEITELICQGTVI